VVVALDAVIPVDLLMAAKLADPLKPTTMSWVPSFSRGAYPAYRLP
jgi:hypothetical protein